MLKHMILFCALSVSLNLSAGVVGDFSKTKNIPGYIDLNKKSQAYKGPWRDKQYNDGVIVVTPSELISQYMVDDQINTNKIEKVIADVKNYLVNARISYCQRKQSQKDKTQKGCDKGFPSEKIEKKWLKNKVYIALKFTIKRLEDSIALSEVVNSKNLNTTEAQPFLEAFFDGIELYQGIVREDIERGRWGGLPSTYKKIKEIFKNMHIKKDRMEAANLFKKDSRDGQLFYSPEELENLQSKGVDISQLDPIDSGFWRKPQIPISEFDTTNYNRSEVSRLKKLLKKDQIEALIKPTEPISVTYKFESPKVSGESPKINVEFGKAELKLKLTTDRMGLPSSLSPVDQGNRMVQGSEVNAEIVANNLAAAMGFTVDANYYKDIVNIFFEDEVYEKNAFDKQHKKLMDTLSKRYNKNYNIPSALSTVKIDKNTGRKYLEVRHVQLERKSHRKTEMSIGFFKRKGLGKVLKREHRAFTLFLAWIWDFDTKDANDKLKIVTEESYQGTDYKLAFSNSDMGAILGLNHPNFYNFDLVKKVNRDKNGEATHVKLFFPRIYPLDIMKAISIADAKWITRMMAQLTPAQIENAFNAAGYPKLVSKYYTGLMLKKRNQLVKALNLFGENYIDVDGKKKEIKKTWEFTGTIKGFEEFFSKNHLTDPDNRLYDPKRDPFPRYWGTSWKMNKGEPQIELLKLFKLTALTLAGDAVHSLMLENMSFTNEGFRFQEMNLRDTALAEACAGSCFFQGATQFGVEGFFPWRFIVENPNKNVDKPYWIVDMFRYGFFLGKHVEKLFDLGVPSNMALGLGGKFYRIKEFIKITPVGSLDDFFKNGGELLKTPKLSFKGARKSFVSGMQEGDILITSSYIGTRAEAKIRPLDLSIPFVSPAVVLGGDLITANRVTIEAGKDQQYSASWDKLKQVSADFRLNLIDFFIQIPVLEIQIKKLNKVQRTFSFNMNDNSEAKLLLNNMNATTPENIPLTMAMEKRSLKLKERNSTFGLPFIYQKTKYRKKRSVEFEDIANHYKAEDYSYEKKKTIKKLVKRLGNYNKEYSVKGSVNSKNEIYARVKLLLSYGNVDKKVFKKILAKYQPLLPDKFIQFDPESVLQNFGTLEMDLETIFSGEGLKKIFSKSNTKSAMCFQYSSLHKLNWGNELCDKLSKIKRARFKTALRIMQAEQREFVLLWKRYDRARTNFWKALGTIKDSTPKNIHTALGDIVATLTDSSTFKYQAMKLFINLAGKENFYRRAIMRSGNEAFPGAVDRIEQEVETQGGYDPQVRMLSDNSERAFEIFTDDIHEAIGSFFLNNNYLRATGL